MMNEKIVKDDIPKIFWKYYDLFRRKKITLSQYSNNTGLPVSDIEKFLREIVGKSPDPIEKAERI